MYSSTITSIPSGEAIETTIDLEQGDPLIITLFNIYINDLPLILEKTVQLFENLHLEITSVTSLLFADDFAINSPPAKTELQMKISILENCCKKWELNANFDKTLIMVFNKQGTLIKNKTFLRGKYNCLATFSVILDYY